MSSLPADYFAVFGIPPSLALDLPELQRQFYVLSKQFHPDRFARASAAEQRYALDFTSLLNDAWRVLRDPQARGEYLLKANGFEAGDSRSNPPPAELLEEVFELNMALEELRHGDAEARGAIAEALKRFVATREELDGERDALFIRYDADRDLETLRQLRALLNRRRYVENLVRDAQQALS
jgi:molecular chaperone HscB